MNESLPYMRSRYLNGLIYESLYIDSEAIAKMSFNEACQWHGICLLDYDRVLGGSASIHPDERKLTNFALYNLVSELLQNREDCSVFRTDENEIAIVFSYLDESKQAAVLKTKASIAELKKASGQYLKITISAGVGSFVKSLRELSKSYVIAKKRLSINSSSATTSSSTGIASSRAPRILQAAWRPSAARCCRLSERARTSGSRASWKAFTTT